MSVNEFEQQVQQKMTELQLRPSAEVWEEVEKRIRKEKKRRRIIFWFFIFGTLLLGGTGWWITNLKYEGTTDNLTINTNNKPVDNKPAEEISIANVKIDSTNIGLQNKKIRENDTIENNQLKTSQIPTTTNKTQSIPVGKLIFKKKDVKISLRTAKLTIDKIATTEIETAEITRPQQTAVSGNSIQTNFDITQSLLANGIDQKTNLSSIQTVEKENNDLTAVTTKNESIISKKNDSVVASDVKDIAPIKIDKSKKWEWGITSGIGLSGISEGHSIFAREKSYMVNSSQLINAGVFRGPISPVIYTVASPKNGVSWHLGIYGKKKLTKRTAISTGINLSSYATIQQTGVIEDSSRVFTDSRGTTVVNNYYLNGTVNSYSNHYYYLQLPIYYHWQLNKGNKFPLYFQNGLSLGFLAGSDAIVYNDLANVFYQNNKQLNKFQLSYQSGLFTNIFKQTKKPLSVGMLFNYSISKLQKENSIENKHLTSFGIQLGWKLMK